MLATMIQPLPQSHRRSYEGALQILRFNYPMFVASGVFILVAGAGSILVPLPRTLCWAAAMITTLPLFWACITLAVSHLVYDRSSALRFTWLAPFIRDGGTWANIHAGFDQTTFMLRGTFAQASVTPVDLFDPAIMTERSIHRARKSLPRPAGTLQGQYNRLPLSDAGANVIFMLFAAHELRTRAQRVALFREARRALKPGGMLIMAEHLRGAANLVAFGPGAFHFFSRREWLHTGALAGFTLVAEVALTPFARSFIWRKET